MSKIKKLEERVEKLEKINRKLEEAALEEKLKNCNRYRVHAVVFEVYHSDGQTKPSVIYELQDRYVSSGEFHWTNLASFPSREEAESAMKELEKNDE